MENRYKTVGLVTFSWPEAGDLLLSDMVDIFSNLADQLYIVAWGKSERFYESKSENVKVSEVYHKDGSNPLFSIVNLTITQLKIAFKMLQFRRGIDVWVFGLGTDGMIIPCLTAKMLNLPILIYPVGSATKVAKVTKDATATAFSILNVFNYSLANMLMVDSNRLIEEYGLKRFLQKVVNGHIQFIHADKFNVQKPLHQRKCLVGFVGRLSQEKGILNFLEAIPLTLNIRDDISFLIIGDGPLRPIVEGKIRQNDLSSKVDFIGWVPHDDLPSYLNELMLLVIPSYSEGGPLISFEAMACATPVLSTPVGLIPDSISDGKTGFIMENNSPECIARNIIRAIQHPELESIATKGFMFVGNERSYNAALISVNECIKALTEKTKN